MKKHLFLFDMDGTLTPPRQSITEEVEFMLAALQKSGHKVGIITGSDLDYIKQQCFTIFDLSHVQPSKMHFLPCNGTKHYLGDNEKYSLDMRSKYPEDKWNKLMKFLLTCQVELSERYNIPLTGHFINYRESLINWCPIGRNASNEDRSIFERKNNSTTTEAIRTIYLKKINDFMLFNDMNIEVKLGGDTSFDIFPKGWDKSYPINKGVFKDYKIYFVGDRCTPRGNDWEIFNHSDVEGYNTESPEHTIKIVNNILSQIV